MPVSYTHLDVYKRQIYTFTNNYDDMDFNEVYNFKNNVQGTVADLINMNALDSLIKNNSDSQFSINKARNTGIVLYRFDAVSYTHLDVYKRQSQDK